MDEKPESAAEMQSTLINTLLQIGYSVCPESISGKRKVPHGSQPEMDFSALLVLFTDMHFGWPPYRLYCTVLSRQSTNINVNCKYTACV